MDLPQIGDSEFEQLIAASRVVSHSGESVLWVNDVDEAEIKVIKSYAPKALESKTVESLPESGKALISHWSRERSRYEFDKERRVMLASGEYRSEDQFAPELIGVHLPTLSLVMRKLPYSTWGDYFEKGNGIKQKAEEFVDTLVALHGIFGKYFSGLYQNVSVGSEGKIPGLRPRSLEEEYGRKLSYFRMIIYEASPEFKEFCASASDRSHVQIKTAETPKKQREAIRKLIKQFTIEKGLDLEQVVRSFTKSDREMFYGSADNLIGLDKTVEDQIRALEAKYKSGSVTIIHGDYMPSNVFRVTPEPSSSRRVAVCDFPEIRVGHRQIDVAAAIYNHWITPRTPEQESATLGLIRRYVEGVEENEGIKYDQQQFIVETLETRLVQLIRLFAVDCILSNKLLSRTTPTFYGFDVKEAVLDKMFRENFKAFFKMIFTGEVWSYILNFPKARELRRQTELVQEIFLKTGVLPTTRSLEGEQR